LGKTNASSPDGSHICEPFMAHTADITEQASMNTQVRSAGILSNTQTRPSLLGTVLSVLLAILSSPKGNQGGWEGGARGL
jgi:hypothetical protein